MALSDPSKWRDQTCRPREEEGHGMVEKKTRGKSSIIIIIHIGSFGDVLSVLRVWIYGEQFKKFVDPEMHFQS
jgi:hypothetical protein